jgi:very-short-patch-repair endonuclease
MPKKDLAGADKPRVTAGQFVRLKKAGLAREFRKKPTPAEKKAWTILRNRGVLGLKFRRQQVIHGFIVDFYCPELRLALELDGTVHNSQEARQYDEHRMTVLRSRGIRTVRLKNEDVTVSVFIDLLRDYVAAVE